MSLTFLVLAPILAAPPEADNLYRSAKVGDWVEFTYDGPTRFISRQTVVARSAEKLTLRTETVINGKTGDTSEMVIDLKGPYPPKDPKPAYTTKTEVLETKTEKVTVKGRSLDCEVVKRRATLKPTGKGKESVVVTKVWTSSEVPLGGMVRMETDFTDAKMVTELTNWGRGK